MPAKMNIPVSFYFQKAASLKERTRLKRFIKNMVSRNSVSIKDIKVVFCDDHYLLNINKIHLKHNYFTDIITFDYSRKKQLEAEIYISVDRVKENALELGVSFRSELHRVIFHGILHLLGYKDKNPRDKSQMRSMEDVWIKAYGF